MVEPSPHIQFNLIQQAFIDFTMPGSIWDAGHMSVNNTEQISTLVFLTPYTFHSSASPTNSFHFLL